LFASDGQSLALGYKDSNGTAWSYISLSEANNIQIQGNVTVAAATTFDFNGATVTDLTGFSTLTDDITIDAGTAATVTLSANGSGISIGSGDGVNINNTGAGTINIGHSSNQTNFAGTVNFTNATIINTPDTSTGGAGSQTATALDVTKTLQVLNSTDSDDNFWTLADGTEGQIMHFVPGSGAGSNQHNIEIANWRRWDSDTSSWIVEQELTWQPFRLEADTTFWTGVATAIFANGAWQTNNPWID
jgi:hypothetical protein